MQVALLGTGIMGVGITHALLRAGHRVTVWNRTIARARPLADDGATVAESIEKAADGAEAVITILYDADAVRSVAEQLLPTMGTGAVWLQSSTIGPDAAVALGELADRAGVGYLDAPVVGTKAPAEAGELSTLVSGPGAAIERVRPVLEAISSKIINAGDRPGPASALKLVCNAWIGMLTTGTAQSIALAEAAGLDPQLFLSVIKGAAVDSGYAQLKGPMMINSSYDPPAFPVDGVVKDLGLIKDLVVHSGIRSDLVEVVRGIFTEASADGHGAEDMAAVRTQFDVDGQPGAPHSVGAGCKDGSMTRAVEVYGRAVLISGPESLLADRAVAERLAAARAEDSEVEIAQVEAAELDRGSFAEITGGSLFSSHRVAVIRDLGSASAEVQTEILAVVGQPLADAGLILVHPGGVKGKALLDKLKKARVERVDCPTPKTWELPKFVAAEAKRAGSRMDSVTAQAVVDAVGHDLRSLASAVSQLASDSGEREIPRALVQRYFGGRAEVTSFAVADAALAGRAGQAMEQLRWALSTGVAPVLVTSALASGLRGLGKYVSATGSGMRDADLAREVGVPPWKLKTMRSQARGWDERGLASALRAVAVADAEIKGAADDAEYALERVVLTVTRSRAR